MLLAADWCSEQDIPPPFALTVDHGLRQESAAEADRVAGWCETHSVPHKTLKWHGRKPSQNIQALARDARYRLLGAWLSKHGVGTLLTGHTLDDQAETFLLRLARGSGLDGLSGMAGTAPFPLPGMRNLQIARPLLTFSHARLIATLRARGQEWIEDPSNHNDRFARVQIRALGPALADAGITQDRIAAAAANLRRARDAIEVQTAQLIGASVEFTAWGYGLVAVEQFSTAPDEVALRAFSRLIQVIGGAAYPPRFDQLHAALTWLASPNPKVTGRTLGGCRLVRRAPGIVLVTREETALQIENPSLSLSPGQTGLWDRRFEISIPKAQGASTFEVRALGAAGVKVAGPKATLPAIEPRRIASALPGVWQGSRLVSAPFLNFHKEIRASARFIGLKNK